LRASRPDRLRFWHAYRRARRTPGWSDGLLPSTPAGEVRSRGVDPLSALAVRALERRALASNLRFWRAQDCRRLAESKYSRNVTSAVAVGHAVADLEPRTVAALLEDPDAPFKQPGTLVLKDSRSSTVIELEMLVNGRTHPVIYKRFLV